MEQLLMANNEIHPDSGPFKSNVKYKYNFTKKVSEKFTTTQEHYLSQYENENRTSENNEKTYEPIQVICRQKKGDKHNSHPEKFNFSISKKNYSVKNNKKEEKIVTASVWMCNNSEINLKQILPAFNIFAKGNDIFNKMYEIFSSENQEKLISNGFPVKVQVPQTMSIRGNLYFENFQEIPKTDLSHDIKFLIPSDYVYESREILQKTLKSSKKRLFLTKLLV